MAKNKGKRKGPQRNSAPSSSIAGGGAANSATRSNAGDDDGDERASAPPAERASVLSIEPTPSTDNVIPFPRPSQANLEAREGKATLISGTGALPLPGAAAKPAEAARPAGDPPSAAVVGERERTTVPPEEAPAARANDALPPLSFDTEPPPAKATQAAAKANDAETLKTLRGEVVGKKEERRGHKESLSTHLSDEAKAFFSEAAATAAYKQTHDTFEDLAPAAEDHASEVARSRRWMTITGVLLVAVIVVVAGFALQSRYSVPETQLSMTPPAAATDPAAAHNAAPAPTPAAAEPATPPPAEPTAAPAEPAAAPTPVAAAEPAVNTAPTTPEPAAVAPTPAPPAPEPVAAAPTPPAPTPPAPVAPPAGQTPQQMLAAARAFRGPLAGKVAAYNAYFDANPTDDRTMTTYAMSLAEGAHHAEAEAVANRAVTANPRSGQAWFVLAYARSQLHNREGTAEARTRCIALGGTWATECRAVH